MPNREGWRSAAAGLLAPVLMLSGVLLIVLSLIYMSRERGQQEKSAEQRAREQLIATVAQQATQIESLEAWLRECRGTGAADQVADPTTEASGAITFGPTFNSGYEILADGRWQRVVDGHRVGEPLHMSIVGQQRAQKAGSPR